MKTLQVGLEWETSSLGGADRVFAELARHLPADGVEFRGVVAGSPDLATLTNGKIYAAAPLDSGTLTRLRGMRRTVQHLLATQPVDLIASHFALYTLPLLDVVRKLPMVVHFHGPWAAESIQEGHSSFAGRLKRQLEREVYKRADRVIVLSKAFAQVCVDDYGIPQEKIRVVPGSADIPRFAITQTREQARVELGWPAERRILLAVRRLSARMGLDRLIQAMVEVKKADPGTLLYIAGKGHMRAELDRKVAELGLQENVKFLGFLPDEQLPLAYCAADVSIVPTLAWEGFGLVAAESLAAGTPCLVTPVGGLPEVVGQLSPNLLFSSCDAADIAQGLVEVISGERTMPTREECREYAETMFASTIMSRRTAAVYRELVPQC